MDWRARRGPALLPGDRGVPGGRPAAPPHRDQRTAWSPPGRRDPRPRLGRPGAAATGLTGEAALLAAMTAAAPAGCATSSRPSRPSRTGSSGPRCPACSSCRAARAPARPPSRCTAPRTCSTPTAASSPRRGVLVVGPNADVPALHRPGAARRSARPACCCPPSDELYPGSPPTGHEPAETAGSRAAPRWPGSSPAAVTGPPARPRRGLEVDLRPATSRAPHRSASRRPGSGPARSRRPHNQARPVFAREIVRPRSPSRPPTRLGADVLGGPNLLSDGDLEELRDEVRADPAVRAAVERAVAAADPAAAARRTCSTDAERLASAASGLSAADRDLLLRKPRRRLDARRRPAARRGGRAARRGRQRGPGRGRAGPPGAGRATRRACWTSCPRTDEDDAGDPDGRRPGRRRPGWPTGRGGADVTAAERAAADRTWAFGHVIVDEAQELSAMALADADAPLPGQVDDDRRRRGADRRPGRGRRPGPRPSTPYAGGPVAAGRADHQLPDPGGDHGRRRGRAGRDRPRPRAAAVGARVRRAAVAAGRGPAELAGGDARRDPGRGRRGRPRPPATAGSA